MSGPTATLPTDPAEVERLAALGAAAVQLASRMHDAPAPERLLYTLDEAAAALAMSRDFFDQHVRPDLRIVRKGNQRCKRFVPKAELERWVEDNAAAVRP